MLCVSRFMLSSFYPQSILTPLTKECQLIHIRSRPFSQQLYKSPPVALAHSTLVSLEVEKGSVEKKEPKIKWRDIGPDITVAQKQAISQLPPKMTNRCKALMKRIICFSPQDESLSLLLAAWVKVMKPCRADWLAVLKEMKRSENPLLLEVSYFSCPSLFPPQKFSLWSLNSSVCAFCTVLLWIFLVAESLCMEKIEIIRWLIIWH